MPNKRSDDKRHFTFWIDKKLKDQMHELAEQRGMNATELLTEFLKKEVTKRKPKKKGS